MGIVSFDTDDRGLMLVDKPSGVTSYDVIRYLKKSGVAGKIGHAGTLDPLASGLIVIGVGKGTKALTEIIGKPKSYVAEITLGASTSSGDSDGEVTRIAEVPPLDPQRVTEILAGMNGTLELPVPAISAVKMGGSPLYKRARMGEKIVLPVRKMRVMESRMLSFDGKKIGVLFDVGSGVYIRSLAEELGRLLGVPAHVSKLRRISIGDLDVSKARAIGKGEILLALGRKE